MRIAWFTPFSSNSSIGRCSQLATRELARYAEVEIWHPPGPDLRQTDLRTIALRDPRTVTAEALSRYDLLVFSLGNYLGFHKEIYEVSMAHSGIVILHDFVMHHFFAEYWLTHAKRPQSYIHTLEVHYGEAGREIAAAIVEGKRLSVCESDEVVRFPLFEEAIRGALGVVTHSEELAKRVRQVSPAPVAKLFLAHEVSGMGLALTRQSLQLPDERALLVTIGHVNPNKQIHTVIEALGAMPSLAKRVIYAVVGPHDETYYRRLKDRVRELRLDNTVRFTGEASDDLLHAYVRLADVCINLRFPAFEGASGSLVEEMLHAKPVLAYDTGFYAELPGDCLVRLPVGCSKDRLGTAIERLIDDPDARRVLGERAFDFAQQHFRASRYAEDFLKFAGEVRSRAPLLRLSDRIAGEMNQMGVTSDAALVERVSYVLGMFVPNSPHSPAAPEIEALPPRIIQSPAGLAKNSQPFSDYDYDLKPRYGHGQPPHAKLYALINAGRDRYAGTMKAFLPFVEDLKTLPLVGESDDPSPAWINDFLPVLDSAALYCFVALLRPRLYVEVGSGNSTKFVRRAIERHKLPTKIVSIDPHPRAAVDALCDKVIRQPLEEVNLEIFSELREGDILFIDHSHRALMNSDATVVFLDILPQLAPGVLVQIHDIFLPSDYPAEWSERYYSEQYLLACYLLSNAPPFEIVLPAAFISGDADLRGVLDPLWKLPHMRQLGVPHGGSFWVRMLAARSATDTE